MPGHPQFLIAFNTRHQRQRSSPAIRISTANKAITNQVGQRVALGRIARERQKRRPHLAAGFDLAGITTANQRVFAGQRAIRPAEATVAA